MKIAFEIPMWMVYLIYVPCGVTFCAVSVWVTLECIYQSSKNCKLFWYAVAFYAHKKKNLSMMKRAIATAEDE